MQPTSAISSSLYLIPCSKPNLSTQKTSTINKHSHLNTSLRSTTAFALNSISNTVTFDPSEAQVTWQIVAGAVAGVVPFVVAGVEFSKRIAAQRNCKVCKGSGLVLRSNKYYFRCPGCGGFLPWQSWRRFFRG